jgi:hypothetical protein
MAGGEIVAENRLAQQGTLCRNGANKAQGVTKGIDRITPSLISDTHLRVRKVRRVDANQP